MKNKAITWMTGVAFGACLATGSMVVASAQTPVQAEYEAATPVVFVTKHMDRCKTEDSVNCVWDAKHMGNGKGHSFKVDKNGKRVFISHKKAHQLAF